MKSKKSHEEWKNLVEQFNKSGLSMTQFSKENGVKGSTFIYWVKMFNNPGSKVKQLVKLPKYENIVLKPIHLSINGFNLEIPGNTSTEKISKILSTIREII